jgi:nucleotide-binding universal stress UspA family protein
LVSLRSLTEPDRGEDDHHSGELSDRQPFVERDPADQHRGERAEEPEDADACDGKEPDAAEPDDVGERGANLLVMGFEGRSGIQRILVGDTADRLLPHLPCSLLTVITK